MLDADAARAAADMLRQNATAPDLWTTLAVGLDWRASGPYWLFRRTPTGRGRPPSRIVCIDPAIVPVPGNSPALDYLPPPEEPIYLPRALPPVGWKYLRLLFPPREKWQVLRLLGMPAYRLKAQARRNGRADRRGGRSKYILRIWYPGIQGSIVKVQYTPHEHPEGIYQILMDWSFKSMPQPDIRPGSWQDILLRHLRAISPLQNP